MEVPERQLTLVSFYGEKPGTFAVWIHEIQKALSAELGNDFELYSLEQIHGTIIGLEGTRVEDGVRSNNRLEHLGEERTFNFDGMLSFLRTSFGGCAIQVGGFQANGDHSFRSQGQFGIGYQEQFLTNANILGTRADNFLAQSFSVSNVRDWILY